MHDQLKQIDNWYINRLRYRVLPLLVIFLLGYPYAVWTITSKHIDTFHMLENPILAYADIERKYISDYSDDTIHYIDYTFSSSSNNSKSKEYQGSAKVSENIYFKIGDDTLIKVTYNPANPSVSRVGDCTNISQRDFVIDRIKPFISILAIYFFFLGLLGYIVFKLKNE